MMRGKKDKNKKKDQNTTATKEPIDWNKQIQSLNNIDSNAEGLLNPKTELIAFLKKGNNFLDNYQKLDIGPLKTFCAFLGDDTMKSFIDTKEKLIAFTKQLRPESINQFSTEKTIISSFGSWLGPLIKEKINDPQSLIEFINSGPAAGHSGTERIKLLKEAGVDFKSIIQKFENLNEVLKGLKSITAKEFLSESNLNLKTLITTPEQLGQFLYRCPDFLEDTKNLQKIKVQVSSVDELNEMLKGFDAEGGKDLKERKTSLIAHFLTKIKFEEDHNSFNQLLSHINDDSRSKFYEKLSSTQIENLGSAIKNDLGNFSKTQLMGVLFKKNGSNEEFNNTFAKKIMPENFLALDKLLKKLGDDDQTKFLRGFVETSTKKEVKAFIKTLQEHLKKTPESSQLLKTIKKMNNKAHPSFIMRTFFRKKDSLVQPTALSSNQPQRKKK